MKSENQIRSELRRLREKYQESDDYDRERRGYIEGRASGLLWALGSDVAAHAYLNGREEL